MLHYWKYSLVFRFFLSNYNHKCKTEVMMITTVTLLKIINGDIIMTTVTIVTIIFNNDNNMYIILMIVKMIITCEAQMSIYTSVLKTNSIDYIGIVFNVTLMNGTDTITIENEKSKDDNITV